MNKTDLTATTIIAYVKLYNEKGINSIYTIKCKGQKGLLEDHKQEIIETFTKNPPKTRDEACSLIQEKYGIKIRRTAIGNFFKKRNVVQKVKKHSSKSKKEQQVFLDERLNSLLEQAEKERNRIIFWRWSTHNLWC